MKFSIKNQLPFLILFGFGINYFAQQTYRDNKFKNISDTGKVNRANRLSEKYIEEANYEKAFYYASEAQQLARSIKYQDGLAKSYKNTGTIYFYEADLENSIEDLLEALRIFKEIKNQNGIAETYLTLGSAYIDGPDYSKSLNYFSMGLEIYKQLENKKGIAKSLQDLGVVYINKQDFKAASDYLFKALNMCREINNNKGVSLALINIAYINVTQKRYPKALEYLKQALEEASGSKELIITIYASMSNLYEKQRDFEKAMKYYKLSESINDSVKNQKTIKEIYEMQAKHESEKNEKEMQMLRQLDVIKNLDLKKNRITIYFTITAFILAALLSIVLYNRFRIKRKSNELLTSQKKVIEDKNKSILDSIHYAERIQRSFIATKEILDENLHDYFVFFKAKDVVSGDFYWASKLSNGNFALATADSTGHGVPGAIMSLLNITSLEKAIENTNQPSEILNETRKTIIMRLKKDGSAEGGKDGMDASLTVYDFKNKKLSIAAANNPVWIIRGTKLIDIKADKMPVGKHDKDNVSFTQQEVELQTGDVVYTLTDGFPDQFGGEKGKKFMYKQLKELLISIALLPMQEQKEILKTSLNNWKGDLEQVDDICLIGVRI
ncbi:MAG TPA: tetratricopeptide repeat protein [Bacteroidia bacterium]|jgi:serine phosphatase RsbU (regulator of sigma subunit)/TPR repeat protein|nr:tetratricopeptide repeat protein [Bacteroidia bacterium]